MAKKIVAVASVMSALFFILSAISYAQEKRPAGEKAKSFWQKLFDYPANITNETAGVVTEAVTGITGVVTKEMKTVGQVTSGDLGKTKDLVTEPLVGTAETTKRAVEGAVGLAVKANKEEPKQ